MEHAKSERAFNLAQKFIPGGVNSPIRAFKSIGTVPPFIKKAKDSYLWDIDDNRYDDYCLSWGVGILGHANTKVLNAIFKQAKLGTSYGAPTEAETSLASLVTEMIPSIEKIRFVNSGTEAVMSALRVARGYTGRKKIIKFDGCYHGHSDQLLVNSGSGLAENNSSSSSEGVTKGAVEDVISIPFHDRNSIENAFNTYKNDIAAVILEPIPANMGVIIPDISFLQFLRDITYSEKSLLIFDEVISGFRVAKGGAQELYGIQPDMTTLGKIIGGGFPIGAFGGKAEIMDMLAPIGKVYQAGTLSGNPVAVTAGITTLKQLNQVDFYKKLNTKSEKLYRMLQPVEDEFNIKVNAVNCMFSIHLKGIQAGNFVEAGNQNANEFASFYKKLLDKGIYLSPSLYETNFISAKHSEKQLGHLVSSIKESLIEIRS